MMLKRLAVLLLAALLLGGLLVYSQHRAAPSKVSGFIEADEIRLGSRVGGRVAAVQCREGQSVQAGDVLVVLEVFDWEAKLAEAEANLAAREAELERLQAGFRPEEIEQARYRVAQLEAKLQELVVGPRAEEIHAAEARRDLAVAQLERARNSYDRIDALFSTGSVTQEEVDRAIEQLKVAEQTQVVRQQELLLLEKGTRAEELAAADAESKQAKAALALAEKGYREEDIRAAEAATAAARSALEGVRIRRQELTITAPVDGVVEAIELQPGDLVAMDAPVLSLMDLNSLWVRAYVPEDRLDLRVGQTLEVTVDSYPARRFRGEVSFISREAEFVPRNVQTVEERSKQVFRTKVRLVDDSGLLRAGMAADVWLPEHPVKTDSPPERVPQSDKSSATSSWSR